jgi:hypothetical protein
VLDPALVIVEVLSLYGGDLIRRDVSGFGLPGSALPSLLTTASFWRPRPSGVSPGPIRCES